MKYCFGVDVGGTTIKLGLFTEKGEILDKWEIKTRKENHAEAVLPDIAEALEQKLQEKAIDKKDVCGIGIGLPAPVTKEGVVMQTANLGWGYKEVRRELEELSGMKVAAGNDANMAALGEMWLGAGGGADNMLLVTLGTGVGGGAIVDGRPLVGANGASTEIGHICVNYKDLKRCGCGKTGCLEQYASATGIARLAKQRLAKDDKPSILRKKADNTAKDVFDAVKAGDEVADEIAVEFGNYLGHALANIAVVCDPTVFVIGGGVSKAGEILFKYIEKAYMEKAFFANKDIQFRLATLGNDAGICGAAKLVL